VIRRLLWIVLGAVLGVTGYRRLSRLARAVMPGGRRGRGPGPQPHREQLAGAALFARDVRDGIEEYLSRHASRPAPNLEGQRAGAPRPGAVSERGALPGTHYPKDGH
jgi:hypothetical protein